MKDHQEIDRVEDCPIGRAPRKLSAAELEEMGKPRVSRGDAIRAHCIDCAGGSPIEVRRCK